jgi:hypothetical protein
VGKPPAGREGADYVLEKPPAEERAAIDSVIEKALEVLPLCLSGDMQTAMQKLHTEEKAPAKKEPEKKEDPVQEPEKKGLFSGLLGRKK